MKFKILVKGKVEGYIVLLKKLLIMLDTISLKVLKDKTYSDRDISGGNCSSVILITNVIQFSSNPHSDSNLDPWITDFEHGLFVKWYDDYNENCAQYSGHGSDLTRKTPIIMGFDVVIQKEMRLSYCQTVGLPVDRYLFEDQSIFPHAREIPHAHWLEIGITCSVIFNSI